MHYVILFEKEMLYLSCIFNIYVEFRVCYETTALLQAQLCIMFKTVCLCLSETFQTHKHLQHLHLTIISAQNAKI